MMVSRMSVRAEKGLKDFLVGKNVPGKKYPGKSNFFPAGKKSVREKSTREKSNFFPRRDI